MTGQRVIMIGLDGFELSVAERMIEQGRLPVIDKLRQKSARFLLDHGPAKRTGLAWEHVSSGLSPEDARRWSAIDFDPQTYSVRQLPATTTPFAAPLGRRCVVFDAPYFDLAKAPEVRGITNWGAHDPGVDRTARPPSLLGELEERFGTYPAQGVIYGFVWPWADRCREMADALVEALEVRAAAAEWLFAERVPDWDLAIVVAGEFHSAIEAMWHGVDETHPLHGQPSAKPARDGIEAVYESGDRMIKRLMDRFPDAEFVLFAMHGMGPNHADLPGMILLPELLYRHAFGKPCLRGGFWSTTPEGVPLITSERGWNAEISRALPRSMRYAEPPGSLASRIINRFGLGSRPDSTSVDWMPATRYRRHWPDMPAFALPSYYDGQIRVNLKGREARGMIERADYDATCENIIKLLHDCRNPLSGEPAIAAVERSPRAPDRIGGSEADLVVIWEGAPIGLDHPVLGRIGPLPYRRPGGHTGKTGFAYMHGPRWVPGDYGEASSFDVVPTVMELIGTPAAAPLSGRSLSIMAAAE